METFEINYIIPLINLPFLLNISNNPVEERKKHAEFGEYRKDLQGTPTGIASAQNGYFAIFLERQSLKHGLIAHEVFHVAHRMVDWIGDKFSLENQEFPASLCEHITNWIYFQLEENNIKI